MLRRLFVSAFSSVVAATASALYPAGPARAQNADPQRKPLPEPEPIVVQPLSNARYEVAEGDAKGMKGTFLLDEAGKVTGIEVGGRIATRVS